MYKSEQIIALCFKLKTLKEVLMEMILMKVKFLYLMTLIVIIKT